MKRAMLIALFTVVVFVAGYLAGYRQAQSGFEVPADWRRERIMVYGELRSERERRLRLEEIVRQLRPTSRPATTQYNRQGAPSR